ncbi:MAG: ABC transporter ATP-binding protein [Oscillospiraceae bacterium]|nr:ABC transporter ATP-binding protein [Oscillospiraceae bacterium]
MKEKVLQDDGVLIRLENVSKSFDGEMILDHIDLEIKNNEFVTFLGPSGCGKTTTLRIIGGFVDADEGNVYFEGKKINDVPPYQRNINTVFQRYALFPHLNVYENIAFGLRLKKMGDAEIREKVKAMLAMVNLKGFERRSVSQLSGGQQQRVAIARALVNEPRALLLDEPLSALDAKLRKDMQKELKEIQKRTGITFIFVTHDQEEALSMSDKVVVMADGRIQQIGTPVEIYNEPVNAFVADFIGESNIVSGTMPRDYVVKFAGHSFACEDAGFARNEKVDVVVRPEDIDIVPVENAMLTGEVTSVTFKGDYYEIIVDINNFKWMIESTDRVNAGDTIGISIDPYEIQVMKRSEYSDKFGDYSSFSDEMDTISDPTEEEEE